MRLNKLTTGLLLLLTATIPAMKAQNSTVTPYSRFGYGMLSDQANSAQKAMGGVGYAMNSGREVNFMNPASYAAVDSLTFLFDMGVDLKVLRSKEGDAKGKNLTGGLNYITMQMPVTKWLGASAGLMPFSEVGYNFGDEIANGTNSRIGSGGLNQLYVGFGVKPFKGLTAGVNVSYLFGTLINDTYVYTTSTETASSATSLFERVIEVRDYNLRFGLQYHARINEDNEIGFGVVYSPKKSLHGSTYGVKYDIGTDEMPDTIADIRLKGNADMAATWGAGINYNWANRLLAEVDFTYQPWKKTKFASINGFDSGSSFNNRWKAGVGLQFVNRPRGSWAQRIVYRTGAYYCNDYIKAGDNSVREYGASLGFGLPIPSGKTMVNMSFEYRHRSASPQPLVKENYFVVTLGVNFNQLWFWRNKLR